MEKTKTIEVSITALRITSEDRWLKEYIKNNGDSVFKSPHFLYLSGDPMPVYLWMVCRNLELKHITHPLMLTLQSLIKEGQKKPIKIYKDMRINTGHKRAACMLFLGYKTIKAIIVPDDYKL